MVKIRVEGLTKVYAARGGPVAALDGVSLAVPEGCFLVIVGPSGCGKTTLLRILSGLEEPTAGRVHVSQADPSRALVAMVFQDHSVLPWLTVRENVAYGLRCRGMPPAVRRAVADRFIELVGLARFADAYPHQLSGGMKQRVSIARAWATNPEVLLMDEPLSALDEQHRVILQQELLRIWEADRKTVMYVTHSIDEALALGDQVLVMTARPGRVKDLVQVDLPRPRDVIGLRRHPRYADLFTRIWSALGQEVLRTASPAPLAAAGAPAPPGR